MNSNMDLIREIRIQCHLHNGRSFKMKSPYTVHWHEIYHAQRRILGWQWVLQETDGYAACEQAKKALNALPRGISYEEQTSALDTLPENVEPHATVRQSFRTEYIIRVSKEYSEKIAESGRGSKVILLDDFDAKTLRAAREFASRVRSKHPEILEPLYQNGLKHYHTLTNEGFTDYDHGYGLHNFHLKPLNGEEQRLGLALAVAEFGAESSDPDELYFIKRGNGQEIGIDPYRREREPELSDW